MTSPEPHWSSPRKNEWFPVCPKCGSRYYDGQILDVKNYPDDGSGLMFLACESCGTEAQLGFEWRQVQPKKFTAVRIEGEEDE